MPDFSQLLRKPLNDVKKPDLLPPGTYHGTVLNYDVREANNEKKTVIIQVNCRITGPGDDVPAELLVDKEGRPIDVTKKTTHADFFMTDAAEYRIKECLESMGIPTQDRTLSECLPEMLNQPVLLSIVLTPNRKTPPGAPPEFFNNCDRLIGTAGRD